MIKTSIVFACFALLPLAAAAHEEGKEGKEGKNSFAACEADQQRLCGEVEPGEGRIVACIMEHEKELSDDCRAFVGRKKAEEAKRQKNPGMAACEADQKRVCGEVEPGEGRIIACMAAHEADLSKACRSFMSKKKQKRPDDKKKDKDAPKAD